MSIVVNLPSLSTKFFSSFYNYDIPYISSSFQEENNKVYFLIKEGLIQLEEEECHLYKFKKPLTKFSELLLTSEYIVCLSEKKIIILDKNNPKKHIYTYNNRIPIIGKPCSINDEVFFIDARSLKKFSLKNREVIELYKFKVEGKISIPMCEIIKHAGRLVFFDRNDSLIFMDTEGVVIERITFPIIGKLISLETATKMRQKGGKFFPLEEGDFKFKMNFTLDTLPVLYRNSLFLKCNKVALCIDDNLNITFLRNKKKIDLLIPNKNNSTLKPINDIGSVNFKERVKYNFDLSKVVAFYRDKFALILRGKVLSIKINEQFKDYLINEVLNPISIFGWIYKEEVNIIVLDRSGEIFKFKVSSKDVLEDKDSDIKVKTIKKLKNRK